MPVARRDSGDTRVIAHLDLDCFYVQVEQRKRPELRGKPVAVVQYNPWKGGGLIAVSYEARQCGVLRCMRGDDAKKLCPDIELLRAPWAEGNAPLNWYRDAGSEVVTVLSRGGVCERASIDEVYLDITEAAAARLLTDFPFAVESLSEEARKMHILGLEEEDANARAAVDWLCQKDAPRCDALLACGAVIIAELRAAVLAETQFTCSAGVAHNKMLAKLTSSMHKPAQQTVIPASYVPTLLASLPLKKIQRLGGKLGKALQEDLGVKTPGDLLPFSQLKLQELYGVNAGAWLWNMARGKNGDEVQSRVLTKSHSCSRAFPGPKALTSMTSVMHWLGELGDRLQDQLDLDFELHNRKAKLLVLHATVQLRGGSQPVKKFPSKSCPLRYGKEKVLADARLLFERGLRDFCPSNQSLSPAKGSGSNGPNNWAVTLLSIGAGDISAIPTGVNPISSFFSAPSRSTATPETNLSTASDAEEEPGGQLRYQSIKDFEIGSTSRTPSSNDLEEEEQEEEPADFFSDGSGSLKKPGSFEEPAGFRDLSSTDEEDVDVDVQCTPTFGRMRSSVKLPPTKSQLLLQLLDDRQYSLHDNDESVKTENPSEGVVEPPSLIQCSPVEGCCSISEIDSEATLPRLASVVNPPESFEVDEAAEVSRFDVDGGAAASRFEVDGAAVASRFEVDGAVAASSRLPSVGNPAETVRFEFDGEATLPRLPSIGNPPPETLRFEVDGAVPAAAVPRLPLSTKTFQRVSVGGSTAHPTTSLAKPSSSVPKLKELWQRSGKRRSGGSQWEWYKQEEIDEEVLAQLPAEIQRELRNSWKPPSPKPQQQRPSKRPSISDFFPSSKNGGALTL